MMNYEMLKTRSLEINDRQFDIESLIKNRKNIYEILKSKIFVKFISMVNL